MARLSVFNSVSLDGYFTDKNADMSWAHRTDPEWTAFAAENASGNSVLLFGRVTYDMMAGYWPTAQARKDNPEVANAMNDKSKIVFSTTIETPSWQNTRVIKGDIAAEVRALKAEPGPDMVILGSGTIVSQLAAEGMVDEFQLVVTPIVLGKGRTLFDGNPPMDLKLNNTRRFRNGNVVLWYERV
jgi:dihydrofolate reductase